jgi:glycosyltransferase involved in cell wall biosynthesis
MNLGLSIMITARSEERLSKTLPVEQHRLQMIRARSKFFFQGGQKFFVRGVTYGPFPPEGGSQFPSPERRAKDLRMIREGGFNLVRVYQVPPPDFLEACAKEELRVLVTIPWEQHVCFLDSREVQGRIREMVREAVSKNIGHPALLGYTVGNEVPAGIVRWYGAERMERFIESLVDTAKQVDGLSLMTYANYPSTEYLLPANVDFCCFNVYLHRQLELERYLARLQNLVGDKPLIVGEFGLDTQRHSQDDQARMLKWHVGSVQRMGLAGTIMFSWTDEWFTGGHVVEDWKFGIVDADRKPKKAYRELQSLFSEPMKLNIKKAPRVSVVVATYNGARTLEACLQSLVELDYPDFEVIIVDDGSTDRTPQMVREYPSARYIPCQHRGLSVARNVGIGAATGEVVAFTDSDCIADKDWLSYLVQTLESGDYAAVGGPNVSPPAHDRVQACVAAAPGSPSHVLLTDTVAEHIPGCNMAFYKWALETIDGFDPLFRKAGDDVDVCWRLQQGGFRIGFSPSAIVWHHRRFTIGAYYRQQMGYGEAEALLRFKHLLYFGATGAAKWKGEVYGVPRFSRWLTRPIVYHGIFGLGLFQCVYPRRESDFVHVVSSIEWLFATLAFVLLAFKVHELWAVAIVMMFCTVGVAISYGFQAKIESRFAQLTSRILTSLLALTQPLLRGWARYATRMKEKRTPRKVIYSKVGLAEEVDWYRPATLAFWNEKGEGREQLLKTLREFLDQEGWRYSVDTGWDDWDLLIYGNRWSQVRLLSVTEEHGDGKRLTRVHITPELSVLSKIVAAISAVITIWTLIRVGYDSLFYVTAVIFFLLLLLYSSFSRRNRIAQIVKVAARRCGMLLLAPAGKNK